MAGYVLVVDDDSEVRNLIGDALKMFGVEGKDARNGHEALQMVAASRPAVIIMDLMMPGLDGFSAITRLHRNEASRDIPIIVISGIADNPVQIMRLPGVVGVMRKGDFSVQTFRALLAKAGAFNP
jgi:CheY-like chemotaxis protein